MSEPFIERLSAYRGRLATLIEQALPGPDLYPARLHEAMRYACVGGKRLRGCLVYAAGEALELEPEALDNAACAVELVHAYSLVHDDLPAMDDDDLRRGRPTVHKAYDEALAILVGDGLQALAFAVLARAPDVPLAAAQRLAMVQVLAEASGSRGMVGGQAVDLESEGHLLGLAELEALHIHKTGALIRACLRLACLAAPEAEAALHEALDRYGKSLGLAYQIQDDILDLESSSEHLGKTPGKDEAQMKSTYPSVMGLPAARLRADELFSSAYEALAPFGRRADPLRTLSDLIQRRDR